MNINKTNKTLLIISVCITIFLVLAGLPNPSLVSRTFSKGIATFPSEITKINSLYTGSSSLFTVKIPADFLDYQLFIGKQLENIELKLKAAKEFNKNSGALIKNSGVSKEFRHKNDSGSFILKNSGELYYRDTAKSKPQYLAKFSTSYFANPAYFTTFAKRFENLLKVSAENRQLLVNLNEFKAVGLNNDNLNFVFYIKPVKAVQIRYNKPYLVATELVLSSEPIPTATSTSATTRAATPTAIKVMTPTIRVSPPPLPTKSTTPTVASTATVASSTPVPTSTPTTDQDTESSSSAESSSNSESEGSSSESSCPPYLCNENTLKELIYEHTVSIECKGEEIDRADWGCKSGEEIQVPTCPDDTNKNMETASTKVKLIITKCPDGEVCYDRRPADRFRSEYPMNNDPNNPYAIKPHTEENPLVGCYKLPTANTTPSATPTP